MVSLGSETECITIEGFMNSKMQSIVGDTNLSPGAVSHSSLDKDIIPDSIREEVDSPLQSPTDTHVQGQQNQCEQQIPSSGETLVSHVYELQISDSDDFDMEVESNLPENAKEDDICTSKLENKAEASVVELPKTDTTDLKFESQSEKKRKGSKRYLTQFYIKESTF